jgi:uncharacterized protein (DUF4213/DUF364 family)
MVFKSLKELVQEIALILSDINFQFSYTVVLAATKEDVAANQIYYLEYLPKLFSLRNTIDKLNPSERIINHFAFPSRTKPIE